MNNCYTALLNILKEYSTLNRLQKTSLKSQISLRIFEVKNKFIKSSFKYWGYWGV